MEQQQRRRRPRTIAATTTTAARLLLVAALAVALALCGGGSGGVQASSSSSGAPTPASPLSYPLNCTQFAKVRTSLRSYIATSAATSNVHSIVFEVSVTDADSGDALPLPGDDNANYANWTKWTWSKDPGYERSRLSMRWHAGLMSLNTLTFHQIAVQLPLTPVNPLCWTSPYVVPNFTRAEQLSAIGMAIAGLLPASSSSSSVLNDISPVAVVDFDAADAAAAAAAAAASSSSSSSSSSSVIASTTATALGGLGTYSLCHRSLLIKDGTLGEDSDSAARSASWYYDTTPGSVDDLQPRNVHVQYTCCGGTQDGLAAAAWTVATGNATSGASIPSLWLTCDDVVEPNETLRIARELILVATVLAVMFMPLTIKPIVDYCNCGCFRKRKRRRLNQKDYDDAPTQPKADAAAAAVGVGAGAAAAADKPKEEEATIQILPPERSTMGDTNKSADAKDGGGGGGSLLHRRPSLSLKAQREQAAAAVEMTSIGGGARSQQQQPPAPLRKEGSSSLNKRASMPNLTPQLGGRRGSFEKKADAAPVLSLGLPPPPGAEPVVRATSPGPNDLVSSTMALATAASSAAARDRARRRRGKLPASESVTWDETLPYHPLCFPSAIEAETVAAADGDFVCAEAEQAYERAFAASVLTGLEPDVADDAFCCCCCRTAVCCYCCCGTNAAGDGGSSMLLGGSAYDQRSGSFRMNAQGKYSACCNRLCCCCCETCCDEATCGEKCRGSLRRELCISLIVVILPALLVFRYFMYTFFEGEELEYRLRWDQADVPLFLDLNEFLILLLVYAPFGVLLVLVDMAKTLNWKSEYLIAQRRAEWATKRAKLKLAIIPPPEGADPNAEQILIRPPTPPGQVSSDGMAPGTRRSHISQLSHDFTLASIGGGGAGGGSGGGAVGAVNPAAAVAAAQSASVVAAAAAAAAAAGASAAGVAAAAAAAAAAGGGVTATTGTSAGSVGGAAGGIIGASGQPIVSTTTTSAGSSLVGGGGGGVRPSVVSVPGSTRGAAGLGATVNSTASLPSAASLAAASVMPMLAPTAAEAQPVIQVVTVAPPPPAVVAATPVAAAAASTPATVVVVAPTPRSVISSVAAPSASASSASSAAAAAPSPHHAAAGANAAGLNPTVPVAAVSGSSLVSSPPPQAASSGVSGAGLGSPTHHTVGGPLQAIPEIVTPPTVLAAVAVSAPVAAVSGSALTVSSGTDSGVSNTGSPIHHHPHAAEFITPGAAAAAAASSGGGGTAHVAGAVAAELATANEQIGSATAIVTDSKADLPPGAADTLARAVSAVALPPAVVPPGRLSMMDNLELAAEAAAEQQRVAALAAGAGTTTTASRVDKDTTVSASPHGTTTTTTKTHVSTITVNVQPPAGMGPGHGLSTSSTAAAAGDSSAARDGALMVYDNKGNTQPSRESAKMLMVMESPAVPGSVTHPPEPVTNTMDVNGFFGAGPGPTNTTNNTTTTNTAAYVAPLAGPAGTAAAVVDLYAAENPMGFVSTATATVAVDDDAHAGYFYSGGLYGPKNDGSGGLNPSAPDAPPAPTFSDYVGMGVFKEMGSAVLDQVKLHAYHYREMAGETKRTRGAAIDPVTALHDDMMTSLWCMFTLRGWTPLLNSLRQQYAQLYCCRCRKCRSSDSRCGKSCPACCSSSNSSGGGGHSRDASRFDGNPDGAAADPDGLENGGGIPHARFGRDRDREPMDDGGSGCCCIGCCEHDGDSSDVAALEGVGVAEGGGGAAGGSSGNSAPVSPRSKYLMRRSQRRRGCCFLLVRFLVTLVFGPTLILLNSVPLGHLMVMLIPLLFQSQSSADALDGGGDVSDPISGAAAKAADEETDNGKGWRHIIRYLVALLWLLMIILMWIVLTQALMEVLLYFCIGVAVNASDLVPTVVFAVTVFLTAVDTMRVLQAPFWELKLIFLNCLMDQRPVTVHTPLPLSTLCPPTRVPNSILVAIMARELNPSHKRTMAALKFLLSTLFLTVVFLAVVSYRGGVTTALTPVGQSGILAFSGLVSLSGRLLGYSTTFHPEEKMRLVAVCKRRLLHYFAAVDAAK